MDNFSAVTITSSTSVIKASERTTLEVFPKSRKTPSTLDVPDGDEADIVYGPPTWRFKRANCPSSSELTDLLLPVGVYVTTTDAPETEDLD